MMDIIKEELKRFCMCSSMKAVPKATNSDTGLLRVFWSVAAIGLFTYTCCQVYTLLDAYMQYEVVTSSYENKAHPDGGHKPTLPVTTICAKTPVPSSVLTPNGPLSPRDRKQSLNCVDYQCTARAQQVLYSPQAYFQTVGWEAISDIGHQADNLIVSCRVKLMVGLESFLTSCDNEITIEKRVNQKFFNCYDFRMKENGLKTPLGVKLGLELTLYMDVNSSLSAENPFNTEGHSSGIILGLSEHGLRNPSFTPFEGLDVPTGTECRVYLNQQLRQRIDHPHGTCRDYTRSTNHSSQQNCFSQCLVDMIENKCSCDEPGYPYDTNRSNENFCLNLTLPMDVLLRNIECRDSIRTKSMELCLERCPLACEERQWNREIQSSAWPSFRYSGVFYKEFIQNRTFAHNFDYMDDVINQSCMSFSDCDYNMTNDHKRIQDNFLRVSFQLNDYRFFVLKDMEKVSLAELLSQVGGALNLWFGITVVVILEIFELCFRLLGKGWGEMKGKRTPSVDQNVELKEAPAIQS
ncbi:hypothetical protein CAPTEDRAFT_216652 [Capitella teleta]|uniref:Uncharacterized protein n=1 Tax=Capitella teleta TaxID=283909 RepID=R7UD39_CAPTE|nr:hypothetical protein CAPTEDRAFT_216652 [Capitella teleta]|eukprot:ELU01182.1 hypothetical protein CAPTEDRAFT_216652 [Capitella teleta]